MKSLVARLLSAKLGVGTGSSGERKKKRRAAQRQDVAVEQQPDVVVDSWQDVDNLRAPHSAPAKAAPGAVNGLAAGAALPLAMPAPCAAGQQQAGPSSPFLSPPCSDGDGDQAGHGHGMDMGAPMQHACAAPPAPGRPPRRSASDAARKSVEMCGCPDVLEAPCAPPELMLGRRSAGDADDDDIDVDAERDSAVERPSAMLPHRCESMPQFLRRMSAAARCEPLHGANRISTCVEYGSSTAGAQASRHLAGLPALEASAPAVDPDEHSQHGGVSYGTPGWERALTAHIAAACSAGSAGSSRRASYGPCAGSPPLGAYTATTSAAAGPVSAGGGPPTRLLIRIPSSVGPRSSSSSGPSSQVVLPPALLQQASDSGANLTMSLERDIIIDDTLPPLGNGMFGTVRRGMYRGQAVAVKALPRGLLQECCSSLDELETFVQEITVLSRLSHDHVVRLVGGCLQPPDIFLCEELCEQSLSSLLHGGGPSSGPSSAAAPAAPARLPMRRRLEIALDVARGLAYLHSRTPAIVHRDIKPDNILISAGRAKISDFGLARCKYQSHLNTARPDTGTLAYMAPECFSAVAELDHRLDLYSFGVVCWEIFTQQRPWQGMSMAAFMLKVVNDGVRLAIPSDDGVCPLAMRRIISSCWSDLPEERPSITHVVSELERMVRFCPPEGIPE